MYLLYALSVVLNLFAGISAAYSLLDEKIGIGKFFSSEGFTDPRFRLVLGLFTFIVGFLKLIFVFNGLPVLGDLIPAVGGMVLGFILILFFYLDRASIKTDNLVKLEEIFIGNAGVFGVAGIIISLVHLVLPGVIFF
jgi:hypothetical protein